MKRKKLLKFAVILSLVTAFTSCSKDDNSTGKDNDNNQNSGEVQFKQKVLLEDITSASCVWCPLATFTTEELAKSTYNDKIISIGVHDEFDPKLVKDPFVLPGVRSLVSALKLRGYPFMAWNRNTTIDGSEFQNFIPKVKTDNGIQYALDLDLFKEFYTQNNLIAKSSPIGIKIVSKLEKTNGKVTFSLKFAQDLNQELKYVVYILEDNLKFQQANASTLYGNTTGQGRWEMNFIHNHVVRATNNFLGEAIDAKESVKNKEFTHSIDLNYTLEDTANASVVVAILNKEGKVLNAQIAKANAAQDYEIVK